MANNEDCAFIPGPPCGNPGVRDEAEAEGYVHIHAGIHGIGSIEHRTEGWVLARGPGTGVMSSSPRRTVVTGAQGKRLAEITTTHVPA